MISAYDITDGLLRKLDCSNDGTDLVEATWVDLLNPTAEREAAVEAALSVAISTREQVRAIDASSQICRENGSLVMTARVVSRNEASGLRLVPATCILKSGTLSGEAVMAGLPAAIVDRAAELLPMVDDELEALSGDIFGRDGSASSSAARTDLHPIMQKVRPQRRPRQAGPRHFRGPRRNQVACRSMQCQQGEGNHHGPDEQQRE